MKQSAKMVGFNIHSVDIQTVAQQEIKRGTLGDFGESAYEGPKQKLFVALISRELAC